MLREIPFWKTEQGLSVSVLYKHNADALGYEKHKYRQQWLFHFCVARLGSCIFRLLNHASSSDLTQTYGLRGFSIICNPSRPTISKLLNRMVVRKKRGQGEAKIP